MREYIPRGMVADAIEVLTRAGKPMRGAELGEAIGCEARQVQSILRWAIMRGLVRTERDEEDRRRLVWSLGDGTPPAQQDDDEPGELPATRGGVRLVALLYSDGTIDRVEPSARGELTAVERQALRRLLAGGKA
jgi:hypothetical protein